MDQLQAIKLQTDPVTLLATLSDSQWLHDRDLHLALLGDLDTIVTSIHLIRRYYDPSQIQGRGRGDDMQGRGLGKHMALVVIHEMAAPDFWRLTVRRLLDAEATQYVALVLLIDVEKARTEHGKNDIFGLPLSFDNDIVLCHERATEIMDKLLDISRFKPWTLRKLCELLYLVQRPSHSARPTQSGDIGQFKQTLELPMEILASLAPTALQLIIVLHESDPELDRFSMGGTTFILANDNNTTVDIATGQSTNNTCTDLKPFLSNPEAIRQLGRVFLTAILSILDTLSAAMDQPAAINGNNSNTGNRSKSFMQLQAAIPSFLSFIHNWIGPETLNIILTLYGEDDAGVSWLLKTMSHIHQRLQDFLGSNIFDHSDSPQSLSTLLSLETFQQLYDHLHRHVHPLEALFVFLESIGYDYQTLLDLLLTLDDKESGGMLAAVMTVLRNFTERDSDQTVLLERWRQAVIAEEMDMDCSSVGSKDNASLSAVSEHENSAEDEYKYDDDDDGGGDTSSVMATSTRARLFNVEFCITQLVNQIRRLHENNLFPYNPKALLIVLGRTRNLLSSVISE
ncbi:hypothetical protein BGZ58_011083 [Dissophora ornata]|nr:hypothetical protein BGZ58_011083 [Dissophora ornata]